jgi:predicted RNA methylase
MLRDLKRLLPDQPVPMRIWRGPFRGARVVMNPRTSLRKAFGLYEHELNNWLESALTRVDRVIDVGANDGYFTFGCAAAFRRRRAPADIVAYEPQPQHVAQLRAAASAQTGGSLRLEIVQSMAGSAVADGVTTLDASTVTDRVNTLIKIDVEGAEIDVIAGAHSWLTASNLFVIEVHREPYLDYLTSVFRGRGLTLHRIDQQSLPVIGRDQRDAANWWLVSGLS